MYKLVKKASVGTDKLVVRRGQTISDEEYKALPKRAKAFFEKVKAEQEKKSGNGADNA